MKFLILIFTCLATTVCALTLKTGTYQLSGGNSFSDGSGYEGEVVIAPQGENYSLIWRVSANQRQIGIGILQDNILSVAFIDAKKPSLWGVVSYRVSSLGDELEGIWTSYEEGAVTKPEILIWKNDFTY